MVFALAKHDHKIKKDAQFAWQRLPVSRDFPIEARLDGRR
jgi:hypothetical protein